MLFIKKLAKKNKFFNALIYVGFIVVGFFRKIIYWCMGLNKIEKHKIVCCNTKGKNYGDNAKYIIDEFLKQYPSGYDIVWILEKKCNVDLPDGIRRVDYGSLSMVKELATAKVWIDTNLKDYGVLKRKGQYYIQTWHGSYGLKKIYYDMPDGMNIIDLKNVDWNSNIEDLIISNSRATTDIYRRSMRYSGEILESGSPRNDIFFGDNEEIVRKVRDYYKIKNQKIVLYAPTFREKLSLDAFDMDYRRVCKALKNKYGSDWILLLRLHPNNMNDMQNMINLSDNIIDATKYGVMQELLVASDILITDYSSCILDFVTSGKVGIIYASDIEQYHNDRGFYYDMYNLPFPVASNNDELEKVISDFNEEEYQVKLQELFDYVMLCEHGDACKQVVDKIIQYMSA